jgi:hypothetical protein
MFIHRLLFPVFAIIIISGGKGFSQSSADVRTVNIVSADSIIKTTACYQTRKQKPQPEYNYYWYDAGKINHNTGGFSGKPLHGKYEVFDNQQKMRVKGIFEYGLMTGNWTRWYPNGNIQTTCTYKKGMLQGKVQTYTVAGKLLSELNYRNGLLQGKSYFYQPDTTIIKKYKAGIEIIKKDKVKSKRSFLKKDKSKKTDPQIKTTTPQPEKQTGENKSKKKWWKLSFLKKKQKESEAKK